MAVATTKQLAEVIAALLARPGVRVPDVAEAVAVYLLEERRTRDLSAVMRAIEELRTHDGIYEVTASSAFPLSQEHIRQLKQLVSAHVSRPKTIIIDTEIDEAIIGGVRVASSELALDTTVSHALRQLTATAGTN